MQYTQFFIHLLKDFYLFLEKGEGKKKERERNIDVREKHLSVASHTRLDQARACNQPRNVHWLRIEPATFQFARWHPTNWDTLDRAPVLP